MSLVVATTLGILFSLGTYLTLRKNMVRVVIGSLIISQAANIYLIAMGGLKGGVPVLEHEGAYHSISDPVVQALVLTAIVIGFATTAFILTVTYRLYEQEKTVKIEEIEGVER